MVCLKRCVGVELMLNEQIKIFEEMMLLLVKK